MSAVIKIIVGAALIAAAILVPELAPFFAEVNPWFATILFGAGSSLALGGVAQLLASPPRYATLAQRLANQLATFKYPVYPRRIIIGHCRVGGLVTFEGAGASGTNLVYLVITLSGHQIQSIDNVYMDGALVTFDANRNSTGTWNGQDITGNVHVQYNLGSDTQAAFSDLISDLPGEWTSAHTQSGCAGVYVRINLDPQKFTSGLPNITFDVHGANQVFDPRNSTTGYSENVALALAWYLSNTRFGMAYNYNNEINQTNLIAAANICDESVALSGLIQSIAINAAGSGYTVGTVVNILGGNNNATAKVLDINGSGGVVKLQLVLPGSGYVTANALSTSINSGSGAGLTVNVTSLSGTEARYTANGAVDTSHTPGQIISELCAAMGGSIAWVAGQIMMFPAAWQSASVTLSEADFRAPIRMERSSRRDLFNSVKGTYVSPANNWQAADFPPYSDSGYLSADGGFYSWKDLQLPFVISPATAQRLARMELQDARRQWVGTLPCKLSGWQAEPGDVINVNYARFSWVNKTFRVLRVDFKVAETKNESPMPVCDLRVKETGIDVYGWQTSYELSQAGPAATGGPTRTIRPRLLTATSPATITFNTTAPGNFQLAHGLGRVPVNPTIVMTSPGEVWFQTPTMSDATYVYLSASDSGITGEVLVW